MKCSTQMLLQSQKSTCEESRLLILPALPEKWRKDGGHIRGLLARGGIRCDIYWTQTDGYAVLHSETEKAVRVTLGEDYVFADGSAEMQSTFHGEWTVRFKRK